MKLSAVLLIVVLAGVLGACEKHSVSQLSLLEPAHHAAEAHPEDREMLAPNEKMPEPPRKDPEAAPKYFQDKK